MCEQHWNINRLKPVYNVAVISLDLLWFIVIFIYLLDIFSLRDKRIWNSHAKASYHYVVFNFYSTIFYNTIYMLAHTNTSCFPSIRFFRQRGKERNIYIDRSSNAYIWLLIIIKDACSIVDTNRTWAILVFFARTATYDTVAFHLMTRVDTNRSVLGIK